MQHVNINTKITSAAGPLAVASVDLDLGGVTWRTPTAERSTMERAMVLLRNEGWPVGVDVLPLEHGELTPTLETQLLGEVPTNRLRETTPAGPVSVVICTRNRADNLRNALEHMLTLDGPEHEVVVVDNAPSDDATAKVVSDYGDAVRYVVEPVPGLARARNCGLAAAEGKFVAFTDDDVEPDPAWLTAIGATFAGVPGAVCVSGSVLPTSLGSRSELLFQEFGGYLLDFHEAEYHLSLDPLPSPVFPFHPRLLGTGANMSFRAEALRAIGGFDPALGAGTPARGGEDIDISVRLLQAGHLLVRQPAAVLWHPSHTTDEALLRQLQDYGCGLAAVFTKFMTHRSTAPAVLRRLPAGLKMLLSPDSQKNEGRSDAFPPELRRAEWRGLRHGPFAYAESVRAQRQLATHRAA